MTVGQGNLRLRFKKILTGFFHESVILCIIKTKLKSSAARCSAYSFLPQSVKL